MMSSAKRSSSENLYLDTSAYLAILLGDSLSDKIQAALEKRSIVSSIILLIETERNLLRLYREKLLTLKVYEKAVNQLRLDIEGMTLRNVTPDLCLTGSFPAARTPRSNDLIHIRTALWFQKSGGIVDFISLDREQLSAAREVGVPGNWVY